MSFFYLEDFVADVGKRAGNYVGKSTENLVDFDRNWIDGFEQHINVKTVVWVAQDQTDSKKNWDDSSILGCMS